MLVQLAVAIVLGAKNLSEVEALQAHHHGVGPPVSDTTTHRTLAAMDTAVLGGIARMRARVRRHVWTLLALRPGGFPLADGRRETAAPLGRHRHGCHDHHRRLQEGRRDGHLQEDLWPSSTRRVVREHLRVPGRAAAAGQRGLQHRERSHPGPVRRSGPDARPGDREDPGPCRRRGRHPRTPRTPGGVEHRRRTVRFTSGWTITDADEKAIAKLPTQAWEIALNQDGSLQEGYFVAELTGLNTRRPGWINDMRLIVRRVKPSGRHLKDLTAFEKKTG